MNSHKVLFSRAVRCFMLSLLAFLTLQLATPKTKAQDTVTGAFEGTVNNSQGAPIAGASVQFINQLTEVPIAKRSDAQGRFYQGLLPPGNYTIRVSAQGYQTKEIELRLLATRSNTVVPVPVTLELEATTATTTPTPAPTSSPATTATPAPTQKTAQALIDDTNILSDINTQDGRRGGAFTDKEVSTLPLGSKTLVRTFDDLALLLPGVAAPPQTIGNGTGPGLGAGVGTSGQFAVNGLRSRANNFTVDGSDNNDEDIGVRRQGFFALVPQPIESIQEFQVITLLAPAQFGRNIGAQVNAVSKSGGNETHGTIFGFFNSSQLNARNVFDSTGGSSAAVPLTVGNQSVINCTTNANCLMGIGSPITVRNQSGSREDSFTLAQGGFVLGGPLKPNKMFYFISAEGQNLNATKEVNFAVPTIPQRGLFNSGATGLTFTPFADTTPTGMGGFPIGSPNAFFPTSIGGDAIFSLFPFPNNPNGVYGANTFTQSLPASAQGKIVSGKFDANGKFRDRSQAFTARYNFTDDFRDIPVTGGALFSRLRARVRTQNFSTFLNSELSGPNTTRPIFNQLRASYGRTRLSFDEGRDTEFQRPSNLGYTNSEEERFLLNAPLLSNFTLPPALGVPNTGVIPFRTLGTVQGQLGPVGQVDIAGFSPVGVDVFNFPQRRVNNTYQVADTVTVRAGTHSFSFGTDIRRTELNSDLPRNSRPLITFNGTPRILFDVDAMGNRTNFRLGGFLRPQDLAAAEAPSGIFQTLQLPGTSSAINLRFYQYNFFAQDEWRIRPNFSLSYGLRYEYNTPPREVSNRIEDTFSSSSLSLIPNLRQFIEGRSKIFDSDRNNFAPRIGFAYSPNLFGPDKTTVIRGGYGLFYDQILGAVVSQSRNVFPNAITVNFAGGFLPGVFGLSQLNIINPSAPGLFLVQPGTLNTLDLSFFTLPEQIAFIQLFGANGFFPGGGSGFSTTLPSRTLKTPMAHQYSVTFEQQLSRNLVVSAAYVGTLGRNLLRVTTPNLGPNNFLAPLLTNASSLEPNIIGVALPPGVSITSGGLVTGGRPTSGVGPVNIYRTNASSRYDSLQLQARGRFMRRMQYQVAYTLSRTTDDVSDMFDLAGASALPQNSRTFAGERAASNFDARHRISYNFIYELPEYKDRNAAFRFFFGGLQIASSGFFHTGQPFTVNSIYDVNLDGNLTDRLNSTSGIRVTGDRSHPLELTTSNTFSLLAPIGQDGSVPRNSFRSGNVMELDLSIVKKFAITESKNLTFRMDIFNFPDRANYGIPVRFLEAPGFGRATDTVTPGRRIQFALKYTF